jgi:signal transduction histidine kinase
MGESWPDTKRASLDAAHSVGVQLVTATDLGELRDRAIDSIIHLIGARRAGLIELAEPAGDWGEATIREADEQMTSGDFSEEDRLLIAESLTTGRRVVAENLPDDGPVSMTPSYSVMVAPLKTRNRITGALYAENNVSGFDDGDRILFETLAFLAAPSVDNFHLNEALLTADQAKREFVSLVTHQIRIPLTSISGYAELLLSNMAGSLTDQQMDFLNRIKRNVDRMSVLVRDLSDINRLESGRMQLKLSSFDLKDTVASVASTLTTTFEARQQEFLIDLSADELPLACANRSSVRRALKNLLVNASLYTPQGGRITVRVSKDGRYARTEVSDSGIGISEDDQARLFTPFFRSEVSGVREHVGWGLGLVVARRFIEAQGGELTWTSEPDKGSTFAFTVPLAGKGIC